MQGAGNEQRSRGPSKGTSEGRLRNLDVVLRELGSTGGLYAGKENDQIICFGKTLGQHMEKKVGRPRCGPGDQ